MAIEPAGFWLRVGSLLAPDDFDHVALLAHKAGLADLLAGALMDAGLFEALMNVLADESLRDRIGVAIGCLREEVGDGGSG